MASSFQKLSLRFLFLCNLVLSVALLLLYYQPYSNQDYWWWLNLLALGLPLLLILQLAFLVLWLLVKRKYLVLPFLTMLLAWPLMRSFFATNLFDQPSLQQQDLRLATWNVALLHFYQQNGKYDPRILSKARALNADVLLLQEFVYSEDQDSPRSLNKLKKKLGFRYAVTASDPSFGVYSNASSKAHKYQPFCVALFSNFPILRWEKVKAADRYNYTFLWADLKVNTDTIRIVNVHLQSMYFVQRDYEFIENIHQKNLDEMKVNGGSILRKMRSAYLQRAAQTKNVEALVASSPYPVLLAGDFNDVPNSFTYQVLTQHLEDAFAAKGAGVGRTFTHLAPTLRIDHVLHSASLVPLRSYVANPALSDHLPVVADFKLKGK